MLFCAIGVLGVDLRQLKQDTVEAGDRVVPENWYETVQVGAHVCMAIGPESDLQASYSGQFSMQAMATVSPSYFSTQGTAMIYYWIHTSVSVS